MSPDPLVIVGAGPAGLSCAESYREGGGSAPVVLLGDDPHLPYERPALSKELLRGESGIGEIGLRPDGYLASKEVELRTGAHVTAADAGRRQVTLGDGSTIEYGSLVLATGAVPAVPDIEGVEHPAIHTLRRVEDSIRLRSAAAGRQVLIVGSGFIGCEAAASLAPTAAHVTVATTEDVPLAGRVGDEVGNTIAGWMRASDVELRCGLELRRIEAAEGGGVYATFDDARIRTDLVLLALGIERRTELAEALGIALEDGAIPTDERMCTEVDGVLAAGDVARAHNAAANRRLTTEHWGEALEHGRVAGAVLAGDGDAAWAQAPGFWSIIGDRTVKQVAWGDGFDRVEVAEHGAGAFTARYSLRHTLVGVLTHEADHDYERGRELVEAGARWP